MRGSDFDDKKPIKKGWGLSGFYGYNTEFG